MTNKKTPRRRGPKPLPLRAQICIRQRDALLRRPIPQNCPMSRREFQAMMWEFRAMDVLYRGGPGEDDWGMAAGIDPDCDAYDAMPF